MWCLVFSRSCLGNTWSRYFIPRFGEATLDILLGLDWFLEQLISYSVWIWWLQYLLHETSLRQCCKWFRVWCAHCATLCVADLTISPVHQAGVGLVHPSRGISMRFPRFISARNDKKPEDASSPSDIADLFHQQTRKLSVPGMVGEQKEDSEWSLFSLSQILIEIENHSCSSTSNLSKVGPTCHFRIIYPV